MSGNEQDNYDLLMPFLPVRSKGGPYDDDAFVAGYEMGLLDMQLVSKPPPDLLPNRAIHIENRGQADLIAMRHGFVAEFDAADVDGWVYLRIREAVDA